MVPFISVALILNAKSSVSALEMFGGTVKTGGWGICEGAVNTI